MLDQILSPIRAIRRAAKWLNDRSVEAWLFLHYDVPDMAARLDEELRRQQQRGGDA